MKLDYIKPALDWNSAIPIGNGSMGAMIFARPCKEIVSLNDDTLWTGYPVEKDNSAMYDNLCLMRKALLKKDFKQANELLNTRLNDYSSCSYQPLGDIQLDFQLSEKGEYKNILDTSLGISKVSFLSDKGKIVRETFASYPDRVIVMKISCENPVSFSLKAQSEQLCRTQVIKNTLIVSGNVDNNHLNTLPDYRRNLYDRRGMAYAFAVSVKCDGEISEENRCLNIKNARETVVEIVSKTGFRSSFEQPVFEPEYCADSCLKQLENLSGKTYEELYQRHKEDWWELYKRNNIVLENSDRDETMNVPEMLNKAKEGTVLPELTAAVYDFARYLYISGSRKGSCALNLQGIWNKDVKPGWFGSYTININTQMNYWLVDKANLSECFQPLEKMLSVMSVTGAKTARKEYGCSGFMSNHNVDIWGSTQINGIFDCCVYFPLCGAWLATHLFDHFEYTNDIEFLKRCFPIIRGAAEFACEWLVEYEGKLHTMPSTSPEHSYRFKSKTYAVTISSTADIFVIKQIFRQYLSAAEILNEEDFLTDEIREKQKRLPECPVNKKGYIDEWYLGHGDADRGHRHISHLTGYFPFDLINAHDTPELCECVKKSLDRRVKYGGGHTGWSAAWLMIEYARLGESEKAFAFLKQWLSKSVAPNLFDLHPPFQIDGNFGAAMAISEMLVHVQGGVVHFLSVCSEHWKNGSCSGMRLKGGYTVNFQWKNCRITSLEVYSEKQREIKIYASDRVVIPGRNAVNNVYTCPVDNNGVTVII